MVKKAGIHPAHLKLLQHLSDGFKKLYPDAADSCEDIAFTVRDAAGHLGFPTEAVYGAALGSDDDPEEGPGPHVWLDVGGRRFDPKEYVNRNPKTGKPTFTYSRHEEGERLPFDASYPTLDERTSKLVEHIRKKGLVPVKKSEFEERVQKLRKTYAEIAPHLDPASREHFESIPNERRDWFKRKMFDDTLTGAMNANAYNTMGVAARPGVHVRLDMNDLKALNDTHGHEAGNGAITSLGNAALQAARANQGQLFRIGGDEFHAHFEKPEQAYSFLRHLHSGASALVPTAGTHKVSFSAGVGTTPQVADQALYKAKAAKTAKFGDLRHDPRAITGHGQHFVHSLVEGAAGPVKFAEEPAIPPGMKKPEPRVPMPMPRV